MCIASRPPEETLNLSPGGGAMPQNRRECGWTARMQRIRRLLAGFLDDFDDFLRVRQERDVARLDLGGLRVHALRQEALEIGVDGAIFLSDDVPGRNCL